MANLQFVAARVISLLAEHGFGHLLLAGNVVVYEEGDMRICVPASKFTPEFIGRVHSRLYSPQKPTPIRELRDMLVAAIDQHPVPELTDFHEAIEKAARKRGRRRKRGKSREDEPGVVHFTYVDGNRRCEFRGDEPGVVHFTYVDGNRRYVLSSNVAANTRCIYEAPMINRLRRCWTAGQILNNFCLLQETKTGYTRLYELDAISIVGSDLFVFELKAKKYGSPTMILEHFVDAAQPIKRWVESMHRELRTLVPVMYMRGEDCGELSPLLNHIFFGSLPETFDEEHLRDFLAYPMEKQAAMQMANQIVQGTLGAPRGVASAS